ncbi:MAG: hypothetical protein H7A32_06070 [Deltaproteobacteria bacterium]|nr:hypothetical protein [Deltaproteobacteria bacterium]
MGIERHFWDTLEVVESKSFRLISEENISILYEHGFVDSEKISLEQWKEILHNFPEDEGKYRLTENNLFQLSHYLYQGPIRKPFSPDNLKEGPRDPSWLEKLYLKVLQYETTLSYEEWQDIIRNEIMLRYTHLGDFVLDSNSKEYLKKLIDEKNSRLRRLELWVHEGPPDQEALRKSTFKAVPQKIEDRFETSSPNSKTIESIEKSFHSPIKKEKISDEEALNFLDEIETWGDDEESPFS